MCVSVCDNFLGYHIVWEYVHGLKSCNSFAVNDLIGGNEDSCLQAIVVCDGEYCVISAEHGKFDDKIHGNCLKGESIWFCSNGIQRGRVRMLRSIEMRS